MSKTVTLTREQMDARNEKARAARAEKKRQAEGAALAAAVIAQAAAPAAEPTPEAGTGLKAAKAASKRPSKARVIKPAAAESAPESKPAAERAAAAASLPPVVTDIAGFNVLTGEQRAAWYEAATGRDAEKVADLLGACVKAFKAGKRPPELTSAGAVVKRGSVKKGAPLPKGDIVSQLTGGAAKAPGERPRGLLSAPAPDARLKIAEDTSRIRSGFTHDMLVVAQKLVKKSGSFTRAELFAKFPEVSRAKLTDAFYCGTERGVYVPA